jgi:hypothetical protein
MIFKKKLMIIRGNIHLVNVYDKRRKDLAKLKNNMKINETQLKNNQ